MTQPKQDVLDSSTKNNQDDPTSEGKKSVMPDGRKPEDVWAENQRKTEENKNLKSELESMKEEIAELKELEEQRKLTAKEQEKLDDLQDDVKIAAKKLREQKESQPWIQLLKEETGKSLDQILNLELERANDFLEDMADELGKKVKDFAKELQPYALKYQDKRPERRNQLAYRDWKKDQDKVNSISEREKKLKEKEDEDLRFRETGLRIAKDSTIDDKFNNAKKPHERAAVLVDLLDKVK